MLKTLYSRDSMGRVRVWYMEQYKDRYRTISGLQDGERVISEWTIAKAKNLGKANETSAEDQAKKEVEAKYKKQLKTGYFENLEDIDKMSYVEPMLAKNYKDYRDVINLVPSKGAGTSPYLLQCKFNGMRCIATKDGLFTRKGEKYVTCPHIENCLKSFFKQYPNAVLDGELFNEELKQQLNEISKLIRKTKHITEDDLKKSEQLVSYYVYDGYGFEDMDESTPYSKRKTWINENVVGEYDCVKRVLDIYVDSEEDLMFHYQKFVDSGHEGAMLRLRSMPYEHKRSKNLLKIKPEDSDDAIILDIHEGEGNWAKTGKIITLDWNGKIFNATFKGSYEEGVQFLKDKKKWLAKKVEFLYNGLTGLGIPNFARVDINNCLREDR